MFDADNLRLIEQVRRFRYPPVFWKRRGELVSLTESQSFRNRNPGVSLVCTDNDISALHKADPDLPNDLIPFLIINDKQFPDYYGFPVSSPPAQGVELPVLVWSIHAYVHVWNAGFGAFLDELLSLHA